MERKLSGAVQPLQHWHPELNPDVYQFWGGAIHPKRRSCKGYQAIQRGKSPWIWLHHCRRTKSSRGSRNECSSPSLRKNLEHWNYSSWLGKAVIMPIFKKKDKLDCNNYRGISLLSHAGKILTHIIQQRIRHRTELILSEEQAGFHPGKGKVDQVFTLPQFIESNIDFISCMRPFQLSTE